MTAHKPRTTPAGGSGMTPPHASEYDPEIVAITDVANALDSLDQDARERVLEWASSRYA